MSDVAPKKLKVRFTHQQMIFLEQVRAEGTFGNTMEEVLVAIFREQAKTMVPAARN